MRLAPYLWDSRKWGVYTLAGTCIAVVNSKEEARDMEKQLVAKKAQELWEGFSKSQKCGVRFGIFPFEPMNKAEREGYNGKDLAVALMDVASVQGGMRA